MHLKNPALLEIAESGQGHFSSVRMAPPCDAVTTRVFPRLERDRMALKLDGKDDRLRRSDFKALAGTMGSGASDAEIAIDGVRSALRRSIAQPHPLASAELTAFAAETQKRWREGLAARDAALD